MLWWEASTPVVKEDQATGEMAGSLVASGVKSPRSFSLRKLGRQAFLHEALGQLGVHAVETHHHHPGNVGLLPPPSLAFEDEAEQEPQGPGQQGKDGQQDSQQQHQKRGNEGKSRAGADVGLQGRRSGYSQEQRPGDGRPQGFGASGSLKKSRCLPSRSQGIIHQPLRLGFPNTGPRRSGSGQLEPLGNRPTTRHGTPPGALNR